MEATAKLRNCPGSPRKMRLVIDTIRGLDVEKALNVLKYIPKKSNVHVEKLLMSAVANWLSHNEGIRAEDASLFVKEVYADGGRVFKRFRPAPRGMAHPYIKPTNHITLIIDSRIDVATIKPIEIGKKSKTKELPAKEAKDTKTEDTKTEKITKAKKTTKSKDSKETKVEASKDKAQDKKETASDKKLKSDKDKDSKTDKPAKK